MLFLKDTTKTIASILMLNFMCSAALLIGNASPTLENELTIIGGGIAGALHAYHAHCESIANKTKTCVTIYEKNKLVTDTTVTNIVPSFTPDEILSVVPRGKALVEDHPPSFLLESQAWRQEFSAIVMHVPFHRRGLQRSAHARICLQNNVFRPAEQCSRLKTSARSLSSWQIIS